MAEALEIRLRRGQRESLERRRRQHPDARVRRRATIVLLSDEGWAVAQICGAVGVHRATVTNTRRRWLAEGFEGLADKPREGRPPVADGEYLAALLGAVNAAPATRGFAFTVWTTARLAAYLARRLGKRLSPERVGDHLRAMGYVYGRPKHTLEGKRSEPAHARAHRDLQRLKKGRRVGPPRTRSSTSMKPASTCTPTWHGRGIDAVAS